MCGAALRGTIYFPTTSIGAEVSDVAKDIRWPEKTRELHNHHFDSTVWNDLRFRDDDIVIATWAKSGTTWVQQIIAQLLFEGADDLDVPKMSPWIDLRVPPKKEKLARVEAQEHRRFLKTHLPVDALVFSPRAKYLYIGRDGRDIVWSMYNHHVNANQSWYTAISDAPGRVGPPLEPPTGDVVQYFREWLERDGYPFWSFWENVRSWWEVRDLPNVRLVHFSNLKADMGAEIREIAAFLEIPINEDVWPRILEHCSFGHMRANAKKFAPRGGSHWDEGAQVFIHKGVNGRWTERLPEADRRRYEERALAELGPECARWMASGEMP